MIPKIVEWRRLAVLDISTGESEGTYEKVGRSLAQSLRSEFDWEVKTHSSAGAVMSHDRLLAGEADLAILQENTLESEDLKVIAPLYREAVLVILRDGIDADSLEELQGLKIAMGSPPSGMRQSSRQLLKYYKLSETDFNEIDRPFTELDMTEEELAKTKKEKLDGAIVTINLDNRSLHDLLKTGGYRLLELPDNHIPGFRRMEIEPRTQGDLPSGVVPEGGMSVPATFAILAVREITSDQEVKKILEVLYADGGIEGVFPLKQAAAWRDLNYHNAARRFFIEARHNQQE